MRGVCLPPGVEIPKTVWGQMSKSKSYQILAGGQTNAKGTRCWRALCRLQCLQHFFLAAHISIEN